MKPTLQALEQNAQKRTVGSKKDNTLNGMNVSYIKRRYQGVDMFIGRKKLAEDSLGKNH